MRRVMRFSRRLPADLSPSELAHKLAVGAGRHDLTVSNPTLVDLDLPGLDIEAALARASRPLTYTPAALGLDSARQAVADYCGAPPDRVVLTSSTSEAYAHVIKLLCDVGERIAVPAPSYPLVPHLAQLEGVDVVTYGLDAERDFAIDLPSVRRALAAGARAVVVVSPNNPTGTSPTEVEWDELGAACQSHDAALIIDEVFAPYGASGTRTSAPRRAQGPLTFVLDGLSKAAALPQLKLGWMTVRGAHAEAALLRLEWLCDAYLSVAGPIQRAVPELLAMAPRVQRAINERLAQNRVTLQRALAPLPVHVRADAGWYGCVRLPAYTDEEALVGELAERHGVLVHPGFFYDFTHGDWLVLSLLPATEAFEGGALALARGLSTAL